MNFRTSGPFGVGLGVCMDWDLEEMNISSCFGDTKEGKIAVEEENNEEAIESGVDIDVWEVVSFSSSSSFMDWDLVEMNMSFCSEGTKEGKIVVEEEDNEGAIESGVGNDVWEVVSSSSFSSFSL